MKPRFTLLFLSCAACLFGQPALQRASVARQRESVHRQLAAARPGFFRPAPAVIQRTLPSPCEAVRPAVLGPMIEVAAQANAVSSDLVREVARQESAFRPCAVSSKGAAGLMQLMPATQASLGVGNPFDPQESLMAGAKLLRELLSRYHGDLALALSAYNAGPSRVDQADGIPPIAETRNYVAQILARLTD